MKGQGRKHALELSVRLGVGLLDSSRPGRRAVDEQGRCMHEGFR